MTSPAASGRSAIDAALASVKEKIVALLPEAVETLHDVMANGQSEPARVAAARDLLDRGGMTVKAQMELEAKVTTDVDDRVGNLLQDLQKNVAARALREAEERAAIEAAGLQLPGGEVIDAEADEAPPEDPAA